MKHTIIKFFFLFITMSVLTSSKQDAGVNKTIESLNDEHTCLHSGNEYANNITCKQTPVIPEKKDDTHSAPLWENDVLLSPISRFILLQQNPFN